MSNFGFTDLRLVNPYDVAFREARSAIRSHYILERAQVFESLAEALGDAVLVVGTTAAHARELHTPLYRSETGAALIRERLDARSPVALLFGSEKFGLSNDDLSHCHWLLRIPTRTEHGSMNLGQAVALCLYELRRESAAEAHRFPAPASLSAEESQRLTELLLEALRLSGYVQERTAESTERKLRGLVLRAGIPARDAEAWFGIIRQILWRLKGGRE